MSLGLMALSWGVTVLYIYATSQQATEGARLLWGFGTICWGLSGFIYLYAYIKWERTL